MKLFISPSFDGADKGDGGIRRVVEAQRKYLPDLGISIVDDVSNADVCAFHGGVWHNTSKPVVSHCHGLYWTPEYEWGNWAHILNKQVIEVMRRADVVTAPSRWIAHVLQRGMLLDAPVLYHGVDADLWTPGKIEPYVLWNKTRIDPICNPGHMNALAELAPDVKFISTFGADAPNVEITGKLTLDQAREYIRNAGVYLCTTRETFGIGTLEAMSCGVPVLGFKWGGQAEFIEHGVTGYLANPGDYSDLLVGLRHCISNRIAMGRAARAKVKRDFTWPNVMKQYAELYRSVLKSNRVALKAPKVSVIITCYNLADVLARAVESVVNQENWDHSNTEIVIVNDASPDDTASIAQNLVKLYANIKMVIVTNKTNLYLAGALNAGIAASNGNYIVPLDADNELGPRALRILSDALDADRGLHIAYGAMEVIDDAGRTATFTSAWPGEFDYDAQIRHRNQIPSTSMYRLSVWVRNNGYRSRCRTAEDADFWCRATSYGSVPRRVTDAVCLRYHNRSDSMSHVEQDWPWEAWYPWSSDKALAPFAVPVHENARVSISTYEPALITVVIPVGPGHGKYLLDAIDSLQAQTYVNWRCIVVNDSNETLPDLPSFVNILNTGGITGPSYARNLGVICCKTPLFVPLDADDYLQPYALEVLLEAWKSGEAEGSKRYAYGDFIIQETDEVKESQNFSYELLAKQALHPVTALYPVSAWEEVTGFDEKLVAWEDWDFVIKLAHKNYCGIRVPYPILYYRMQSGSRREDMYANRATMADNIRAKWPKFLVEREVMACGCGSSLSAAMSVGGGGNGLRASRIVQDAGGDLVLLEFVGSGGARTYKGQSTGKAYRFGADDSHKLGYVHTADAEFFKLRQSEFRVASQVENIIIDETVRLEAAGPPVRT